MSQQAARERRCHEVHDTERTRGLASDGNIGGITAERGDVVLHPRQRANLVEQTVIARDALKGLPAELRMREPAQHAEAVVDRHDHHAARGEALAVVHRVATGAGLKRTAIDPDEDRCVPRIRGRPDVQR